LCTYFCWSVTSVICVGIHGVANGLLRNLFVTLITHCALMISFH